MTFHQMLLVFPDLPLPVTHFAYQHARAGNWARFRDYLRTKGIESLPQRREAFDAAQRGHSPDLTTRHQVAAEAARGFPNLACMECAESVKEALEQRGWHGSILDLNAGHSTDMYGNI
jgi:hypothetical protein